MLRVSFLGLMIAVMAACGVYAFKGQVQDVREIGQTLSVKHVLEGSVRSDGEQLRITAQLIQVDDGFHLWSETFDRQRGGVFAEVQWPMHASESQGLTRVDGVVEAAL